MGRQTWTALEGDRFESGSAPSSVNAGSNAAGDKRVTAYGRTTLNAHASQYGFKNDVGGESWHFDDRG